MLASLKLQLQIPCDTGPLTLCSSSMMMTFSFSSDISRQEVKGDLMFMISSLDRMSSFFSWSPVTLVLPAMP